MADALKVGAISTSDDQQTEAATQALAHLQDSIADFLKYQHIYAEAAETKRLLSEKESEIDEKDDKIHKLEAAVSVYVCGVSKEVSRMKLEVEEVKSEILSVNGNLERVTAEKENAEMRVGDARRLLEHQGKELAQIQKEASAMSFKEKTMSVRLDNEIGARTDAVRSRDVAQMQLKVYIDYSANLVDLKAKDFSKSILKIWERTDSFVKKYFSTDISTELFEQHDQWIQQACSFVHPPSGSILVPPTNTPAAKFARQAVMLNVLAIVLAKYIFTATPLPLSQAGLDDVLSELMSQDPNKELLFRAMLVSASTPKLHQEKDIQELAKWIADAFGILSAAKIHTEMKSELKKFLEEAANCWIDSRRSRQKVVATFDYEAYPDSWKSYSVPGYKPKQTSKNAQASDPENEDEVAFLAFPAIVLITNDRKDTIHRGTLIRYSHIHAAEDEWRKEQQKRRRYSRSGIPHHIISPPSF